MSYAARVPPPPLSRFVALLWMQDGPAPEHPRERVLPTGTVELVVSLAADDLRVFGDERDGGAAEGGALVCGAHSRFFVIDTSRRRCHGGGALPPRRRLALLRRPRRRAGGRSRSARRAVGRGRGGRAARAAGGGALARGPLSACWRKALLARLAARPPTGHLAVRMALRALESARGPVSIRAVAERIGISQRRFGELFRARSGLAPKVFSRIRRFQDVLAAAGPRRRWTGRAWRWTAASTTRRTSSTTSAPSPASPPPPTCGSAPCTATHLRDDTG
jgi:AraC-like DNA-binding protein